MAASSNPATLSAAKACGVRIAPLLIAAAPATPTPRLRMKARRLACRSMFVGDGGEAEVPNPWSSFIFISSHMFDDRARALRAVPFGLNRIYMDGDRYRVAER